MPKEDDQPGGDMLRLAGRYGCRGAALIILGIIWTFFGLSVLLEGQEPRPWVLFEHLPAVVHATLWIATGLTAVYAGFRGPQRDDTFGMVALLVMPLVRFMSFAFAWLVYLGVSLVDALFAGEHGPAGFSEGWYGASIWFLIIVLLRLIAGWPNPRKVLTLPTGQRA